MEVDFMIDTGCQVTILATTVFEQMCTADPMVQSKLRPCRRRLVLADSSPLTVMGELELNVVFPGLNCDMLFVVASIGSDGLLGTGALQSCLPPSAGSSYRTIVGRRPFNVTIATAKTDPGSGWILDDFGGVATGQ